LFKETFDLKITIKTNLRIVDFLDVTLNLESGSYKPYSQPNSSPVYINTQSNHPPNIIKRIPSMISERISKISSNKEVFDHAAPFYNNALYTSDYKSNISYKEPQTDHTTNAVRYRSRNIIWFNPTYSMNVKTNVAIKILTLLDKYFPKLNKFHKLFNQNNSPTCQISSHHTTEKSYLTPTKIKILNVTVE